MTNNRNWGYEKLDENMELQYCPMDDKDGSVTGHIVLNVPAWFDENPEERIRLGWIKHIYHDEDEIEYNRQTQFLVISTKQVDEYTIEDVYHVLDKSEDQLLFEEMLSVATWSTSDSGSGFHFF